jgi:predicted phosphodiesterase
MRLAVFADIHANLEALQAVFADMDSRRIDRFMCLGDLVGYGASPNECIELVRGLKKGNSVLGNHDAAAVWLYSPYSMSKDARQAILWTMDQLSEDNAEYLQKLHQKLDMLDMLFVHANPYNPGAYRYVINRKYALRSFAAVKSRLVFLGHSHRPVLITKKNLFGVTFNDATGNAVFDLSRHRKQIINPGSVGQPRDGDVRASYCVYDSRNNQVEFYRVDYDYQKAGQRILSADLPLFLAQRLGQGI